jgi:predicted lipoprotein with Yx(FWY)xxD motif
MKTSTIVWLVVAVIVIAGLVYWFTVQSPSMMQSSQSGTTTTQTASTTPGAIGVVNLGSNAQFGKFLVATNGMTLYTFNGDKPGVSNCTGQCLAAWPPYTVTAGADLSAANITGTIGTITRPDGTLQVTYNDLPLYFFVQDKAPGDVTGNGKDNFSVAKVQ